ncbi:glucosamine-6-phosphate deaminase [Rahnella woolbedingensis]|nr:glucosamine-6-phosphate deaminase [Rahnella woolbedingensis]
MTSPRYTTQAGRLNVEVFSTRLEMGQAAARDAVSHLHQRLKEQDRVRIIFAAAPSQNEFLEYLAQAEDIDWARVDAFHMDEYVGLPVGSPALFSHYLTTHLFGKVSPGTVHKIPAAGDAAQNCADYARLLQQAPVDMVCLGIGENGHLAFNDPPVADFNDPQPMKIVELDAICRQQQVNDGCFPALEYVPTHALTLTIPTLMAAARLFCMVPGKNKHQAVTQTLNAPQSVDCPATVLRTHPACTLYTDIAGFGELPDE